MYLALCAFASLTVAIELSFTSELPLGRYVVIWELCFTIQGV